MRQRSATTIHDRSRSHDNRFSAPRGQVRIHHGRRRRPRPRDRAPDGRAGRARVPDRHRGSGGARRVRAGTQRGPRDAGRVRRDPGRARRSALAGAARAGDRCDGRSVGARQQCGRRLDRLARANRAGRMAPRDGDQRREHRARLQARAVVSGREPSRVDHQHLVGRRVQGRAGFHRVQRIEGGGRVADEVDRDRLRAARDRRALQFDSPGVHSHGNRRAAVPVARRTRRDAQARARHSAAPARRAGRRRACGRVSRVRREPFRDGRRTRDRRRHVRGLTRIPNYNDWRRTSCRHP
ncbi:hypothetical protein F01_420340 [Burkholderia cenocepacia]|nr:hypothetical protein F01_420340 [Burkholderia cenocepacia]